MTNTINNVPRELLERVLNAGWGSETVNALDDLRDFLESAPSPADHVEDARAMVAKPSPAGVDGLEVRAYEHVLHMELGQREFFFSEIEELPFGVKGEDFSATYNVTSEPLCRLSAAQAIIDGLRGKVAEERAKVAQLEEGIPRIMEASYQFRQQRDQQAQRIGELEAALEFACKSLAQVTSSDGSGHADIAVSVLRMAGRKEADASQIVESYKAGAKWRIDAALSAGKEGE